MTGRESLLDHAEIERLLRYEWWLNHGHDGLYGDDGEMQCGRCPADFKREPLERLQECVRAGRAERAAKAWEVRLGG